MRLPLRTLVTGANGFVGTVLTKRLSARGDQVKVLVRSASNASGLAGFPGVSAVVGDVMQPATWASEMADCDVVFHLAGIRRAARREDFLMVNAEGTRRLCEALVAARAGARLVLCGSLAAIGPSQIGRPRVEEDPFAPTEWYGESKAEAERIAFGYRGALSVTVARPPRILGPNDLENLPFFKLVARGFSLSLGGGPRPLTVVDVDDVVDLLMVLAEHPAAVNEAFFSAGPCTTLEELQEIAAHVLGRETRRIFMPAWSLSMLAAGADVISSLIGHRLPLNRKLARQLLAPAWTCSGEKAARVLGFRPQRGLEESVRRSVESYRADGLL